MQRFAVLILWTLVGITSRQWAFSLSQDLEPELGPTFSDDLSLDNAIPPDQAFTPDSNWLLDENTLNSAPEPNLDWFSENVDSNDLDLNTVFSDISYPEKPDLNSLFADDGQACDVGNADDTQLFGKKRRESSTCTPRKGEVDNPSGPGSNDGPDQSGEPNQENIPQFFAPLSIFPKDVELCPPEIFKDSNIPVCRDFVPAAYVWVPGQLYVTLRDVEPRRFPCFPVSLFPWMNHFIKARNKFPQSPHSSGRVTIAHTLNFGVVVT